MPTLLQPPSLMPLPAALRYAREGYAIRRARWDGREGGPALAWLVYRGGIFFRLDAEGREVVQNDEMTREDFLARDWTLLPPECIGSSEVCDCGPGAVGAMPYPDWEDEPDPLAAQDATNPNRLLGLESCQWRTGPCECGGGETSPPPWPPPPTQGTTGSTGTTGTGTSGGGSSGGGTPGGGTSSGGSTGTGPSGGGANTGGTGPGNFGQGGGGGGGSPKKRPRKPRSYQLPEVSMEAEVTDPSCIQRLPEPPCGNRNLPDNSLQPRSVVGTITIGPHPEGRRDLCWITVTCGGETLLRQVGAPGDSFDFGPGGPFRQAAGGSMPVFATVHFPGQRGGTRNPRAKADWPPHCEPQDPCTPPPPPPPPPPPDPSGSMSPP